LSLGASGAELSGDYDASGNYEVWVPLLEMALLDNEIQNGSGPPTGLWVIGFEPAWRLLTGNFTKSWFPPDGQTLPEFLDEQAGLSRQVVVGTVSGATMPIDVRFQNLPPGARDHHFRYEGDQVVGNHAYLFLGWTTFAGTRVARFYNPHGVIAPSVHNEFMPRNPENVLWIAESDLTSIVFSKAEGLK